MKEVFKNVMNIEKPVLTKALAPRLSSFAKVIYFVGLFFMVLGFLRIIVNFFRGGDFTLFLYDLLMWTAVFAILRMFCEYLAANTPKEKK